MPITPVFEQPPVARFGPQLDWTEQVEALKAHPGEWAKVDGPFPDKKGGGKSSGRAKSITSFAKRVGVEVEVKTAKTPQGRWVYARTVTKAAPKPAPTPTAASTSPTRPVATIAAPSPIHDDGTHTHQCPDCGDSFRTNTRLRQHQANAHKAS